MRGTVITRDPRSVQAEHDVFAVESNIEVHLVDRPCEECRVERNNGDETLHCHARCRSHSMLLSNAHIEAAIRESLGKSENTCRVRHGGGDRNQLRVDLAELDQRLSKRGRVAARLDRSRVVHELDRVTLGRAVAPPLLGQHMDDNRTSKLLGVSERPFDCCDIVTVVGPEVAKTEIFEECGRFPHVTDGSLGCTDTSTKDIPDQGGALGKLLELALPPHVCRIRSDTHEALRELRDSRCVASAVVVEHDGDISAAVSEIVQALKGHASCHCSVADHGDYMTLAFTFAVQLTSRRNPVRMGQDSACVTVLNHVVLGLLTTRIAAQTALLTQVSESLPAAGDDLVHIRLMARVPQDRVSRRLEHAMQSKRELNRTQVRTEVPTVLLYRVHNEGPNLGGEHFQLVIAEVADIGWTVDVFQIHGWRNLPGVPCETVPDFAAVCLLLMRGASVRGSREGSLASDTANTQEVHMSFGFGLLSGQRVARDRRSWEDVYAETIDLSVALESLGYDSVWTTEHHFVDDGYMPSLLVTSAAIAAATTTIGIATGVLLAPLHDPVRLAEDAATVQVISDGRLILGLGLGWSTVEFDVLGVPMTKRGMAMSEILQFLPKAWSGEPFTWAGDVYSYPEIAVRPAPSTPIPVVIGGGADVAIRRAARYADGFFSNASPATFAQQVRIGTEEMERVGRDPSTFRWIYYGIMYPGPTDEIAQSVFAQMWKYSDMEASATRAGLVEAPQLDADSRTGIMERIMGGSSAEIVETLGSIRETVGVPIEWVARSYFSDIAYGRQLDIAERIATEVMPFAPTG